MSSRKPPGSGEDTPDTWEHSDEVQVPFLQTVLQNTKVLPIIFGDVDPARVAAALAPHVDDGTLLLASSDLSHYHPYSRAKELDTRCVQAICNLDIQAMQSQEACGKFPILTLLHIARQKGWKAKLLDYRNSGDAAGEKDRVVSYAAIAFYAPGPNAERGERFTAEERHFLLDVAKKSLRETVTGGYVSDLPTNGVSARLLEPKGCFVTLTERGQLRGCIGNILPVQPLCRAVASNAESAASHDPRFQPVRREELEDIHIEISILTEPQPLHFISTTDLLNQLQPKRDGVVLRVGNRSATYLPQVWDQLPDKVEFMNSLAEKAGCTPGAWRNPSVTVSTYQVEAFGEGE
jgi:AmmeMemoRadiSam system protein A